MDFSSFETLVDQLLNMQRLNVPFGYSCSRLQQRLDARMIDLERVLRWTPFLLQPGTKH